MRLFNVLARFQELKMANTSVIARSNF